MSVIANLEPKALWKHFDAIRKIPHGSGNEEALGKYVLSVGKSLGLESEKDSIGNIIIRQPANPGHENTPTIIVQSHLDMVCEKDSTKEFDFSKDKIQLILEGQWLTANGTTLGSDNGIGLAATLAMLEDTTIGHGPIEGLFTVSEETGLNGAKVISPDALKGRIMLNLDSEALGVFSIGCAGGADSSITLPLSMVSAQGDTVLKLHLSGLRGGHSGIDIHEGRGNAVKILNRLLRQIAKDICFELVSLDGGDKHNAIPREAIAVIAVTPGDTEKIKARFNSLLKDIIAEFKPVEKNIKLDIEKSSESATRVLDAASQLNLLSLLFALPHGPLAMSRTIENLVETSNNLASIKCKHGHATIVCSSRSSNDAVLNATRDNLAAIAGLAGAKIDQPDGYPGWMPNLDSPILKVAMETYQEVTGEDARYKAIHAGLECGIIGENFPGMDMISFGPTIQYPHSPEERVQVDTVDSFYQHLLKILERMAGHARAIP